MDWAKTKDNEVDEYINAIDFDISNLYETDFLEVNETISELSYLTHDYFRYYGKFPSKVAKYIIDTLIEQEAISRSNDFIFDNYNGSGTTMVEAKIAGFSSGGIDINPFGVLASNVKTYNYNVERLQDSFANLFDKLKSAVFSECRQTAFSFGNNACEEELSGIAGLNRRIYIEFPDIDKWFDSDTISQLSVIKYYLLRMPKDRYREFFVLGFFAIIRRVSRAYDAEVRPHVNLNKRKRDVFAAYEKKISEMITTMQSWNKVTSSAVDSKAYICDNSNRDNVTHTITEMQERYDKTLGLVVSHPPYLNCFDYVPVYRLKFLWAFGFDEIYGEQTYQQIKNEEIRSYPATNAALINKYFMHNFEAYRIVYDCLRPGGYCCVVIGDCTINKRLFSVHKMFIKGLEVIGFSVEKVTYRSTAYGLGRYAYRHKADYCDTKDGKQDAIIFFKK